jgi:IclR family mhp operon transcriptional activator
MAAIRSISRALAILQAINRRGSMSLTEIAAEADLPYPTVTRIVQSLVEDGFIARGIERKRFHPTALVRSLSLGFQEHDELARAAQPCINALTKKLAWPVSIVTRVGLNMMVRASTHAQTALTLNLYYPGYTLPILGCASGKAFVAFTTAEERRDILDGLKNFGRIEDRPTLKRFESPSHVRRIRADGYATNVQNIYNETPGKTSSIAVPLFHNKELIGALTLIFFSSAMKMADAEIRFAPELKATAQKIAATLPG